jgi:hypothetical protein
MVKDGLKSESGDLDARNRHYNEAIDRAGMFKGLWKTSVKVEQS